MTSILPPARLCRVIMTAFVCITAAQTYAASNSEHDTAAPPNDAATLSAVEVVGQAGTGISWHAGNTAGAKTALPVRELPQSVRVITAQTIEDLDASAASCATTIWATCATGF